VAGVSVELWPYARHNMTADDKAEVHAYAREHGVRICMGYNAQRRWFFAAVGDVERTDRKDPMAAFRLAIDPEPVQPIRSVMGDVA
jgi:hypothetical protein